MGREKHGDAAPVELGEKPQDLQGHLPVDIACRLVGEHDLGREDDGSCQRRPLPFATRKLGGARILSMGKPDPGDELVHMRGPFVEILAGDVERQGNVLANGQVIEEAAILMDDADSPPHAGDGIAVERGEVATMHMHRAARRPQLAAREAQKRRLARARRPGQEVEGTGRKLEVQIFENVATAIGMGDVVETYHREPPLPRYCLKPREVAIGPLLPARAGGGGPGTGWNGGRIVRLGTIGHAGYNLTRQAREDAAMRLKCPGCGALYEVDDDAIPPEGREVMCAGCGTTWFQTRPEPAVSSPPGSEALPPAPEGAEEAPEEQAPPAPSASHRISPETLRILREEVEIAASLRKGVSEEKEAEGVVRRSAEDAAPPSRSADTDSTSGHMAPPPPDRPVEKAPPDEEVVIEEGASPGLARRRRGRRLIDEMASGHGGTPPGAMPAVAEGAASGGGPPAGTGTAGAGPAQARRAFAAIDEEGGPETREGHLGRAGFWFGVMLVGLAAAIYLLAPRISAAVPDLGAPLERYVATIDAARLWLDAHVRSLSDHLWRFIGRMS